MQQKLTHTSGLLFGALGASLVLASCNSKPPAQTTTVNVEVPAAATAENGATKDAKDETEIADLRDADDVSDDKPATKRADSDSTDRAGEDATPAKKSAPKPVSSSRNKEQLMDFYDRLPAKHFSAFGGVNRRSLLNRRGAIVDYKHRFIEIPGSASPADGDLRKLQITLFPNGDEPWCAVSRIVWPKGQTPGALDFYYGESDAFDRHPRTASDDFFPYDALGKNDDGYLSAYLPREGLEIYTSAQTFGDVPDGELFRYNRNFKVGEPAFVRAEFTGNF